LAVRMIRQLRGGQLIHAIGRIEKKRTFSKRARFLRGGDTLDRLENSSTDRGNRVYREEENFSSLKERNWGTEKKERAR